MDARFLDMLEHAGHDDIGAVAQRVDIDLDRIAQIAVDQHRRIPRHLHRGLDIIFELILAVDDLHRAAAEDIARPGKHRIADARRDRDRLFAAARDAVFGLLQPQLVDQSGKAFAVFGQVDRIGRRSQDGNPRLFERASELERRLAAELDDHARQRALRHFDVQDFEHVLDRQRFEIEAVRRVVIGRHRFGVAVDHDRFIARILEREAGVATAIVEFDPLPDPVRPAAQDHDLLAVARVRLILGLAKARRFISRIEIGGLRLEFGGAGVDRLVDGAHAQLVTQSAHLGLGDAASHRLDRFVDQPGAVRDAARAATQMHRLERQIGEALVRKAHRLQFAQPRRVARQAVLHHRIFGGDDLGDALEEPHVIARDAVDLFERQPFADRLRGVEQPVGGAPREFALQLLGARADEAVDEVEARQPRLQPAQRLLQRFMDRPPDRHHLAHRLHRGREQGFGPLELFEGKARDLGDDIIDRRLERGRGHAGDVVHDLVERVADRQLRRDLGDREARRFRRERRRARHARVHLDHDQAAVLRIDRELHVRPARLDPDLAQHRDARVAHDLIFLVGQRQRRRDGDAVAGMHAHRIDIFDRADDDAIVLAVAHHLHLELLPAEERFLDQDFGGGRGDQAAADDMLELLAVIRDAAAGAAEREGRADDRGQPGAFEHRKRLVERVRDAAARAFQPDLVHRVAELLPVLGLVDRLGIGADHLDAIFFKRAVLRERQRGVERGLPTHRRQHRVGPLLFDDLGDDLGRDRLDIGRVGQVGIGHDRRRVGVDEDDAIALLLQRLDRLRPRIVELARLTDNDRAGADDEDGLDVGSFGHYSFSVCATQPHPSHSTPKLSSICK